MDFNFPQTCADSMFAGLKGGFLAKKSKKKGKTKQTKKLANSAEGAKHNDQKQVKAGPAQPPSANASSAGGEASAALAKVLELISRNEVEFNGVTKKILVNEKQFQQAMYPLDTKAAIEKKGLPTSFQKLISSEKWRKRLLAIMPQVCAKVESIVAGVKARAAKTEQPLDAYSEMVLRPQILLEAFGRGVIKMMHAYGRDQHAQLSRSDTHLASIESGSSAQTKQTNR